MKLNIKDNIIDVVYSIHPRQWYLRLDIIPFIVIYIYLVGWWLSSAGSNDKVFIDPILIHLLNCLFGIFQCIVDLCMLISLLFCRLCGYTVLLLLLPI